MVEIEVTVYRWNTGVNESQVFQGDDTASAVEAAKRWLDNAVANDPVPTSNS